MTPDDKRRAAWIGHCCRHGRTKVYVTRPRKVGAPEKKISSRKAHIREYLALNTDARLMDLRLSIVPGKQVETWCLRSGRGRRGKDRRISQTWIGNQRAVERDSSDLNSILRVRCAQHNAGRAAIEDPVTCAQNSLLVNRIAKSKTRREIIV